jgi:hypothetical protein
MIRHRKGFPAVKRDAFIESATTKTGPTFTEDLTKSSSAGVEQDSQTVPSAAWLAAINSYGRWLNGRGSKRPGDVGFSTRSIAIDHCEPDALAVSLQREYARMAADDFLLVDAPAQLSASDKNAMSRDSLGTALFRGGFESPMMWTSRKALIAEFQRGHWLGALLPAKALGAAPERVPNIEADLIPPPNRIYAIARRSALAPPEERPWRLSVVMPVYNERKTFCEVMDALLAKSIPGFDIEICLVESNSTDGTRDEVMRYAHHPRVRLLLEDKPSGKGHAVRAGLGLASGDILLIQDADLEYNLDDYEKLLEPLRSFRSNFVLGSRHPAGEFAWQIRKFIGKNYIADVVNLGHVFFTWLLNFIFRQRLRDPFTMYKVFRRDCIHNVIFECNRFDFDIELVAKLLRCGHKPLEIDIDYQARSFDEGKKVAFFGDPPTWVRACLKHRFSTLYRWPEAAR